nr:hypothetical protein REQ54_00815 [Rhizobium sp. Q54]
MKKTTLLRTNAYRRNPAAFLNIAGYEEPETDNAVFSYLSLTGEDRDALIDVESDICYRDPCARRCGALS